MPIAVKTSVQIRVAFHGVTLSRDYGLGPLSLNLLSNSLAVIALIRDDCLCCRQLGNQRRCRSAVIDLAACDFKLYGQAMSAHHQINLAGIAGSAFPYSLIVSAGSTCTLLVSLGIAAINEHPLHVRFRNQHLENLEPFAGSRPGIEALVDLIPFTECLGQVSLGASRTHAVQHALYGHS